VDVDRLEFADPAERYLGQALATADILAQMAAPDYPRRLGALYREFAEGQQSLPRGAPTAGYRSATELIARTRQFYVNQVRPMLDQQWGGVYRALEHHFEDGRNHYLEAIEKNLDCIDGLVGTPGDAR